MDQQELFPLKNPCVGVCKANDKGYCQGCLRSRQERQVWQALNNPQKRHVLRLCFQRRKKLNTLSGLQKTKNLDFSEQLDFDF